MSKYKKVKYSILFVKSKISQKALIFAKNRTEKNILFSF